MWIKTPNTWMMWVDFGFDGGCYGLTPVDGVGRGLVPLYNTGNRIIKLCGCGTYTRYYF